MDAEVFKKHILGKKVAGVQENVPTGHSYWGTAPFGDALVLEDGTLLNLYMSDQDCCAGAEGEWNILSDPDLHGGITDVEIRDIKGNDEEVTATLNILYGNNTIARGDLYADSGNDGYYFSVLSVQVIVPSGEVVHEEEVLSC